MNKKQLLLEMKQAVDNTKELRDQMDMSWEKFKKSTTPKQRRLFTIRCKAKDLPRELEKLQRKLG